MVVRDQVGVTLGLHKAILVNIRSEIVLLSTTYVWTALLDIFPQMCTFHTNYRSLNLMGTRPRTQVGDIRPMDTMDWNPMFGFPKESTYDVFARLGITY